MFSKCLVVHNCMLINPFQIRGKIWEREGFWFETGKPHGAWRTFDDGELARHQVDLGSHLDVNQKISSLKKGERRRIFGCQVKVGDNKAPHSLLAMQSSGSAEWGEDELPNPGWPGFLFYRQVSNSNPFSTKANRLNLNTSYSKSSSWLVLEKVNTFGKGWNYKLHNF